MVEYRISFPTLTFRKGRKKVVLWPARPTLPEGPGTAVPGIWPTESRSMRASSPSSTLVAIPTAGISIFPTVTTVGLISTVCGVVPFGWASLAACAFAVARSDMPAARVELPAANSNAAIIVALRMAFLIRNAVYIIPPVSIPGRTKETAPVRMAPVGKPGEREQESRRRYTLVCREDPLDWSLVQNEDTATRVESTGLTRNDRLGAAGAGCVPI